MNNANAMSSVRLDIALVLLIVAIICGPGAIVAKYGMKNRRAATVLALTGAFSTLLFMILIWPYLPSRI